MASPQLPQEQCTSCTISTEDCFSGLFRKFNPPADRPDCCCPPQGVCCYRCSQPPMPFSLPARDAGAAFGALSLCRNRCFTGITSILLQDASRTSTNHHPREDGIGGATCKKKSAKGEALFCAGIGPLAPEGKPCRFADRKPKPDRPNEQQANITNLTQPPESSSRRETQK